MKLLNRLTNRQQPVEIKQPNKYELELMQAIKQWEIMSRVNKDLKDRILNSIK